MSLKPGQVLKTEAIRGKKVLFRLMRNGDAKKLLAFINPIIEEKAYITMNKKASLSHEQAYIRECVSQLKSRQSLHLVAECGNKIIAASDLRRHGAPPNNVDHVAVWGIAVHKDFRNLGLARNMFQILALAAKKEWRIQIVKSSYFSDNHASARLHKKLGFKIVGSIPNGAKAKGKYCDEVIVYKKL